MNNDIQQKALKLVILAQLVTEATDDLRGTALYKGKIKQYGNTLSNLLLSICKQTDAVYGENPELTTNIFNEIDGLVGKLAQLDLREVVMLNQIHDHYKGNQEDWDALFSVELQKLDANV